MTKPEYVEAIGRNTGEGNQHSHLYVVVSVPTDVASMAGLSARTGYLPMCRYGWNRSDGAGFSIFRGHTGKRGLCKICEKRMRLGLHGLESVPGSHKTKWI